MTSIHSKKLYQRTKHLTSNRMSPDRRTSIAIKLKRREIKYGGQSGSSESSNLSDQEQPLQGSQLMQRRFKFMEGEPPKRPASLKQRHLRRGKTSMISGSLKRKKFRNRTVYSGVVSSQTYQAQKLVFFTNQSNNSKEKKLVENLKRELNFYLKSGKANRILNKTSSKEVRAMIPLIYSDHTQLRKFALLKLIRLFGTLHPSQNIVLKQDINQFSTWLSKFYPSAKIPNGLKKRENHKKRFNIDNIFEASSPESRKPNNMFMFEEADRSRDTFFSSVLQKRRISRSFGGSGAPPVVNKPLIYPICGLGIFIGNVIDCFKFDLKRRFYCSQSTLGGTSQQMGAEEESGFKPFNLGVREIRGRPSFKNSSTISDNQASNGRKAPQNESLGVLTTKYNNTSPPAHEEDVVDLGEFSEKSMWHLYAKIFNYVRSFLALKTFGRKFVRRGKKQGLFSYVSSESLEIEFGSRFKFSKNDDSDDEDGDIAGTGGGIHHNGNNLVGSGLTTENNTYEFYILDKKRRKFEKFSDDNLLRILLDGDLNKLPDLKNNLVFVRTSGWELKIEHKVGNQNDNYFKKTTDSEIKIDQQVLDVEPKMVKLKPQLANKAQNFIQNEITRKSGNDSPRLKIQQKGSQGSSMNSNQLDCSPYTNNLSNQSQKRLPNLVNGDHENFTISMKNWIIKEKMKEKKLGKGKKRSKISKNGPHYGGQDLSKSSHGFANQVPKYGNQARGNSSFTPSTRRNKQKVKIGKVKDLRKRIMLKKSPFVNQDGMDEKAIMLREASIINNQAAVADLDERRYTEEVGEGEEMDSGFVKEGERDYQESRGKKEEVSDAQNLRMKRKKIEKELKKFRKKEGYRQNKSLNQRARGYHPPSSSFRINSRGRVGGSTRKYPQGDPEAVEEHPGAQPPQFKPLREDKSGNYDQEKPYAGLSSEPSIASPVRTQQQQEEMGKNSIESPEPMDYRAQKQNQPKRRSISKKIKQRRKSRKVKWNSRASMTFNHGMRGSIVGASRDEKRKLLKHQNRQMMKNEIQSFARTMNRENAKERMKTSMNSSNKHSGSLSENSANGSMYKNSDLIYNPKKIDIALPEAFSGAGFGMKRRGVLKHKRRVTLTSFGSIDSSEKMGELRERLRKAMLDEQLETKNTLQKELDQGYRKRGYQGFDSMAKSLNCIDKVKYRGGTKGFFVKKAKDQMTTMANF